MKPDDLTAASLVREFASLVTHFLARRGVTADEATAAGREFADHIVDMFGGQVFYLPKETRRKRMEKHAAIVAEFNGRNQAQLARKYDVCISGVYRILEEERRRARAGAANDVPKPPQQEQK